MSRRRLPLFAATLLLATTAAAGEPDWTPTTPALPETLATVPGGALTAADFRRRVAEAVKDNPALFALPDAFLQYAVVGMEAARLGVPPVSEDTLAQRLAREAADAGGTDAMRTRLARESLSVADIRRALRLSLRFESVVRLRKGLAPDAAVDEAAAAGEYAALTRDYAPVFYGFQAPARVATIGGRNFTADEFTDFTLTEGRDEPLERLFNAALREQLIFAEAKRRNLKTDGLTGEQTLESLLAADLSPDALRRWHSTIRDEFRLVRVERLLFPFPTPSPSEATVAETRAQADVALKKLHSGEIMFETAAKALAIEPATNLGYLTTPLNAALNIPPDLYDLAGYAAGPDGRSPIGAAPDPAIRAAALTLKDGEISAPVRTPEGFSLIRKTEERTPTRDDALLTFLKRRRITELSNVLLEKLQADPATKILWRPAHRIAP